MDTYVVEIDHRLRSISPRRASLFYACCAERFFPLYTAFSDAERWGNTAKVREYLELAWRSALPQDLGRGAAQIALDGLLHQTPHADDFESVETTFAQDVCLLIASALGHIAGIVDENAVPVDAAFEILRVAHCVESTGFLDLGDDPRAVAVTAEFVSGETFSREVGFQEEDLKELSEAKRFDRDFVARLQNRAISNHYDIRQLLPTQAATRRA